ncbi:MAG: TRAP transporter substrate-binding protein DctP [Myxococcales bacterium]|nr:TRAP transporter substrate-binding protein DctP [Myxococcales bacterium]
MWCLRSMLPLLFVLLFSSLATAKPVEIKIATVAPRGSIWTRIFQRFKARVHKLSKGQVKLRLYPGQVQGDERDVVRKMRTGQLDGGAFTAIGLAMINPEVLVMQMPGMFREYDKLDKARAALGKRLEAGFLKRGYVLMGWGEVGKVHMFSKHPVKSLADLRKRKVWVWTDDPISKAMMRKLGVSPRLLSLPAVLPALNTGMVDTVFNSPLGCAALQWHAKVKYMSTESMAIAIGATVVSKKAWNKVPADLRDKIRELSRKYHRALLKRTRRDNERALATLKKLGIQMLPSYANKDRQAVEKAAIAVTKSFVPRYFSKDLLRKVLAARR